MGAVLDIIFWERIFLYLFCPIFIGAVLVGVQKLRLSIHLVLQTYNTMMVSKSNRKYYNSPNATGNECVTFPLTWVASDWLTDIKV